MPPVEGICRVPERYRQTDLYRALLRKQRGIPYLVSLLHSNDIKRINDNVKSGNVTAGSFYPLLGIFYSEFRFGREMMYRLRQCNMPSTLNYNVLRAQHDEKQRKQQSQRACRPVTATRPAQAAAKPPLQVQGASSDAEATNRPRDDDVDGSLGKTTVPPVQLQVPQQSHSQKRSQAAGASATRQQ
jgi:hypothetical protein